VSLVAWASIQTITSRTIASKLGATNSLS